MTDLPSRTPVTTRRGRSRLAGMIDIVQPRFRQGQAHVVDIEAQLATRIALSLARFVVFACDAFGQHRGRLQAWHHADTVVVGDDNVARVDQPAAADHRHLHVAERRLYRALREDGA